MRLTVPATLPASIDAEVLLGHPYLTINTVASGWCWLNNIIFYEIALTPYRSYLRLLSNLFDVGWKAFSAVYCKDVQPPKRVVAFPNNRIRKLWGNHQWLIYTPYLILFIVHCTQRRWAVAGCFSDWFTKGVVSHISDVAGFRSSTQPAVLGPNRSSLRRCWMPWLNSNRSLRGKRKAKGMHEARRGLVRSTCVLFALEQNSLALKDRTYTQQNKHHYCRKDKNSIN